MNTLVVFDSQYGNTEKIARQISKTMQEFGVVRTVRVSEVAPEMLNGIELLVVGSPTQAWNSTAAMKNFFARLQPTLMQHLFAAAFDTRFDKPRLITGSAAEGMAKQLKRHGARLLLKPQSFLVTGTEGPLAEGELELAAEWARHLCDAFQEQVEPLMTPV